MRGEDGDKRKNGGGKCCQEAKEVFFYQVVENTAQINFKKCPICPMQYDIMVL
jgi:hypothetical protein